MAHKPKPATVAAYQTLRATKIADIDATWGAQIGVNLLLPNGQVAQLSDFGAGTGGELDIGTTDDLDEGGFNLYFTTQRAQDAVGGILTDTSTIDFTYNQTTHSITADLKDTSVTPGSYGSSTAPRFVSFTVDQKGRLTASSNGVTLVAGTGLAFDTSIDGQLKISTVSTDTYVELVDETGNVLTDENGYHLTDNTVAVATVVFDPTLVWSFL